MAINAKCQTLDNWTAFVRLATSEFVGKWYFRGALDDWPLQPSLERAAADWVIPLNDLRATERALLREFKRAYPPTSAVPAPAEGDDLGWLALMQHHGAPTRLLDWTYSPFVAAFFALDYLLASRDANRMAAIWALAGPPTENQTVRTMLPEENLRDAWDQYSIAREGPGFRKLFLEAEPPITFVSSVNPYRLNERLVVQQGLFLCPGNITLPFEENLLTFPGVTDPTNLRKILLPRSVLSEAFLGLGRMNISYRTLFPGVDGYARSQRHQIGFLRAVMPFERTKY